VQDRTTPAHEMIYLLTRSRRYHYDADAIKEPISAVSAARYEQPTVDSQAGGAKQDMYEAGLTGQRVRSRRPNEILKSLAKQHNDYSEKLVAGEKWGARHQGYQAVRDSLIGRNKRSVWTIPTEPFPSAHFATFPVALIEPCVKAGCPKGGTVLDPFGGAGTTGLVADRLGRNAILLELNPDYAEMARRRIADDGGMFAQVAAQ
jgi:hypothetical protein